jgi:hypothetical protein
MRKLFFILGLFFSLSSTAQVPSYVPTNGLLGWWPFEGNTLDWSNNGNHGSILGGSLVQDRSGQDSSAYLFSSNISGAQIELPVDSTNNGIASNFTMVMWVKPTRQVNTVSNSTSCPGSISVPMAYSNQNWAIYAQNFGTDIGVGVSVGTNGAFIGNHANNLLVCRGRETFTDTGFIFVAVVHQQHTAKLYVDGVLKDSIYNYCPTRVKKMSPTIKLGSNLYSPGFSGVIDDFGAWNRALTSNEIDNIYQQVGCSNPPSAPSANSPQYFCGSGTLEDVAFNVLLPGTQSNPTYTWYSNPTGGTPISSTTNLVDGQTYYASQTVNGCESTNRVAVTVHLQSASINSSNDSICAGDPVTLSVTIAPTSNFSIGSTGPAGGFVFYDKGSVTNGWRYLEVAPSDFGSPLEWGCNGTNVPGTSNSIGSGQANTNAILQYCSSSNIAAKACDTAVINGFNDWYLPSRGDFILINQNLSPLGIGDFINSNGNQWNRYWTSSQIGAYAYAQDFTPVYTQITLKNNQNKVRPVRQFASGAPLSTYLWSTGDTTQNISVVPDSTTQYWVDITYNGNTCRYYHTIHAATPPPLASAVQTFICNPTVAQLDANGSNVKWYSSSTGGTPLSSTDTLINNDRYYASQTLNGCESIDRFEVTAKILELEINASNDSICAGDTVSLSAILPMSAGNMCGNLPGSLSNGLSAWYPFCSNANDLSGNNRNGAVSGAQLTIDRFGRAQSAYSFDAFQQINIPNTDSLNHYPLSISLWYNADSSLTSGNTNLFSKYLPASWNGYRVGYIGEANDSGRVRSWLIRNQNNKVLGGYGEPPFEQNNALVNTWYHFVFVVDQNGGKIYVNGQLVDSHPWTGTPGASSNSYLWKIGGKYDTWFVGKIDDLAIWNRALTLDEVQSLYATINPTYLWSTGDTTQNISVVPDSTTQYWVDITYNGNTCRYYHTIHIMSDVTTDTITSCGPYTWIDGNTYTSSNNTATHLFTNAAGCDSVVTLHLSILGTWTQVGTDIDGEAAGDGLGESVSLSSDGSTMAIAATGNDGNGTDAGHVRIYKNTNGTWTQVGADIDGEAAGDYSGISVSLSSDGNTVAIGAMYNDGNGTGAGHVRIYNYVNGTWTQIGADIDGEAAVDRSGISVSLSSDGSTVAIGARHNDGNGLNAGHVRIYKNISGTWTQVGSDIDGEAAGDNSGRSVSLSSDGKYRGYWGIRTTAMEQMPDMYGSTKTSAAPGPK